MVAWRPKWFVLAPGFTSHAGASSQLSDLWRSGAFALVLSEHVLQELTRTLTDPYFARRLPREDATVTELTVDVSGVATHPEDDVVLSTALTRPRIACGA